MFVQMCGHIYAAFECEKHDLAGCNRVIQKNPTFRRNIPRLSETKGYPLGRRLGGTQSSYGHW
jgi:hypothetical protein